MKRMRRTTIGAAGILAFCCSYPICSARPVVQTTQIAVPIPGISPSLALSVLANTSKDPEAKLDPKQPREGIVTYRVFVNANGSVVRRERVSGDLSLEVLAEPFVNSWAFNKVAINGSASSWFSLISVCFFQTVAKMVPCYMGKDELDDKATDSLPTRLFLVGFSEGNHYEFPPLHKTKGANLMRARLVRQMGLTGVVVLDVVIAPDGRVSQAEGAKGYPGAALLLGPTVKDVRDWQFAPVTFLGKPMEVQLRFRVQYGLFD